MDKDIARKIAEMAFEHFKSNHYCSFYDDYSNFFSIIDCTFRGYSDEITNEIQIFAKDPEIYKWPLITYDRSCMLYICIPSSFDDDPDRMRNEFIEKAIEAIEENYIIIKTENELGLTGKTVENPEYRP